MRRKLLFAASIILMVAGIAAITAAVFIQDYKNIGNGIQILLKAVGILGMTGGVACVYFYFGKAIESDEGLQREEKDERNEMIRGKAAQNTILLLTFLLLFVELILICMKYSIPALLIGIVMFLGAQINMLLICYYQKKY